MIGFVELVLFLSGFFSQILGPPPVLQYLDRFSIAHGGGERGLGVAHGLSAGCNRRPRRSGGTFQLSGKPRAGAREIINCACEIAFELAHARLRAVQVALRARQLSRDSGFANFTQPQQRFERKVEARAHTAS